MENEIASMVSEIQDRAATNIHELFEAISRWEAEDKSSASCCTHQKVERQLSRFFGLRRVFAEYRGETAGPSGQDEHLEPDAASKPSISSSSSPAEHRKEKSSDIEADLYTDSTPGTVSNQNVTSEDVLKLFIEDNLVSDMDAKSKEINLTKPGSPREMSFMSLSKHHFQSKQKKRVQLSTEQELDEAGGSDRSEAGSPPVTTFLKDARKAEPSPVPLELVDVEDEEVTAEEKPPKLSTKQSTTSSSPPAEHRKERSSDTETDLYRDSTPGTVLDENVTSEGVIKLFMEDNQDTDMDAKSKEINLTKPGSPREMSFTKMDPPSKEDDKDVCKTSLGDEDVTRVEYGEERSSDKIPSTTSSDTETDLYRDSTPGTVADKNVTRKKAAARNSTIYKSIKSLWKQCFQSKQKKRVQLSTEQKLEEAGRSDRSKAGSPPVTTFLKDARKVEPSPVPMELLGVEDEDVTGEEKPPKLSSKQSTTSSSPPAEHRKEKSSDTETDLYTDSTPGTVADKNVTSEGVIKLFMEDNLETDMDAKSKERNVTKQGSPREMSFTKMDPPSKEDDKDVCETSLGDEDVTRVEYGEERSSDKIPSTTSSDTETYLYRDSTPGTVADKNVTRKKAAARNSTIYKSIKSLWKQCFQSKQKKRVQLSTEQKLEEAGGSHRSKAGSPPVTTFLKDARKVEPSPVPMELLGVEDEDVTGEEKPPKPSSKQSTTSSSPPAEHRKEKSSDTETDLYTDSTPGTVADKNVTSEDGPTFQGGRQRCSETSLGDEDVTRVEYGEERSSDKIPSTTSSDTETYLYRDSTPGTVADKNVTRKKAAARNSTIYKSIKSLWKQCFQSKQKKRVQLSTEQKLDEAGGSDHSEAGSPPVTTFLKDARKAEPSPVPLELADWEDEDVTGEEKPPKPSSKQSTTSSSPPAEHRKEKSSDTETDLYTDSTPGTVADKNVTSEGVIKLFMEDNQDTDMDAKSKEINLTKPGSSREMSFKLLSKHHFQSKQKKRVQLSTEQELDEAGGSDHSEAGSPPVRTFLKDARKAMSSPVPLELVDVEDEDVTAEEKPPKQSTTSASPPAEHRKERSSDTETDLYRDSTPGNVSDKNVTSEGVIKLFMEDNLDTDMDAKSKERNVTKQGSPREMSFTKMDPPSKEDDKDVCKTSLGDEDVTRVEYSEERSSDKIPSTTSSDTETYLYRDSTPGTVADKNVTRKKAVTRNSTIYKSMKSLWKQCFQSKQKKRVQLSTEQELDEAGRSHRSKAGSPPVTTFLKDARKVEPSPVPMELVGVEDEDVTGEEKPPKLSSKQSTTSSSPPAEHRKERSSDTETDLYRDSTPGTVSDKNVTSEGVIKLFMEDNLVTDMDAKSKEINLTKPGSPREMSFTKMDPPSKEDDKDVCKTSLGDEDVTRVEYGEERSSDKIPSTTSSDTETDLYRDSTPGTVADKNVTPKTAATRNSTIYKSIKSLWRQCFQSKQKKRVQLSTEQELDEAGGSDRSKAGSPPVTTFLKDARKVEPSPVPLELVGVEDEEVTAEEKPPKLSSKQSTTSTSASAEHRKERSSDTETYLYRDSTPGTVADKHVTPKKAATRNSIIYKSIKSLWKQCFQSKQKKRVQLSTEQELDEAGGSDHSEAGSPPVRTFLKDARKAESSPVPLELVDVEDEDVTAEEKPPKQSTTSASPPAEHYKERSSDTETDLYRDSTSLDSIPGALGQDRHFKGLKETFDTIINGFFNSLNEEQQSEISKGVKNMDVKYKLTDMGMEVIRVVIDTINDILSKETRKPTFSHVCGMEAVGQKLPLELLRENFHFAEDKIQQSLKGSFGEALCDVIGSDTSVSITPKITQAIVKWITDNLNSALSEAIQALLAGGSNVHAASCCQFSSCRACNEMLAGVIQAMKSLLTGPGTARKKTIQTERTQKHSDGESKDDRLVNNKKSQRWSIGKWWKNKVQPVSDKEMEEVVRLSKCKKEEDKKKEDKKASAHDLAVKTKKPSLLFFGRLSCSGHDDGEDRVTPFHPT
ncbi:dentin sialophosphoprotein-like [Siniperca chuatsi]|uniref:dentin sialophosphoprotein-like n=1 Tax=Siniperca chuatsi TaxID=119488 RepID=UPI001CE08681|nr:dentin sialophosphoprotein-like [Siniperca chuatsi]